MKKLNNKGFTLIELLAVIVILAVVMGIAINSVLSSMNSARGGAIVDTSTIIARAFNEKYAESLVGGAASAVYGDVEGFSGYDFTADAIYEIPEVLSETFGISKNTYVLGTLGQNNSPTKVTTPDADAATNKSFISFEASTGRFVACMSAQASGPNYVTAYKTGAAKQLKNVETAGTNNAIKNIYITDDTMMACSDGTKTWK